jgi:ectoine hydroxylase-related dioxygenase (phytanoyl-CoA dioxygenase family)
MAFHPRYWSEGVENDSSRFNYYEWNGNQRKEAAKHVKSDTRWQPHAAGPLELEPEIRLICNPGAAIMFAAAQLHSTVPNTSGRTRYSFDFRTVNVEDLRNGHGAPNVDSAPSGTSLRDFLRVADRAPLPEDILMRYGGPLPDGVAAVFQPV